LNNYLRTPRTQLDYQVAASFFAISAVKDDTIYYSRCNFSRSAIHCFDLVYPAGEKHAWDSIVTRISLSLRPLQREFAAKPEAELTQQFHAEFGYFHPGARLRRDVRFALASFASGAVLGAIAIVAVYVSYAKPENASARGLVNNVAAETGIPVVPGSATAEHRNQQRQVRPSTAENTAVVAKLPLGRPDSADRAMLPGHPETPHNVPDSINSMHIRQIAVETSPELRTGDEAARSGSGRARARREKASSNLISGRGLVPRERRKRSIGSAATVVQWKEPAPQAHASAYGSGRTLFWDWSR
jgi:hypothetical protein